MLQQQPSVFEQLEGRLHPMLKWCFAGAGAMAGFYYARKANSPIPSSYVITGAAMGFLLLRGLFASLQFLRTLALCVLVLIVINYALLIPYGYGDHMPTLIAAGTATLRALDLSRFISRWGKNDPPSR